MSSRSRSRVAIGAMGILLILAGSLLPSLGRVQASYAIGAKTFSEQYVLSALIEQRLTDAGLSARHVEGLGSNVIFNALAAGEIDVYVDYSGTIWATQMGRSDVKPRAEVLDAVSAWLMQNHGIKLAGALGFENAYALAMPRKQAEALKIRTIADLARHAPRLSIAGDYEFFSRPEWKAIRDAYGLAFRNERQMQPEFMYPAAGAGEVDVISAYTSDGRVAQYDLVVLDDDKHAIPPYDAILLVSARRANDPALLRALAPLTGAIDVTLMREANRRAAGGNTSPATVARWLWEQVKNK